MLFLRIDKEVSADEVRELVELIRLIRSAKSDPQYTQPVCERSIQKFSIIFVLFSLIIACFSLLLVYVYSTEYSFRDLHYQLHCCV